MVNYIVEQFIQTVMHPLNILSFGFLELTNLQKSKREVLKGLEELKEFFEDYVAKKTKKSNV